LLLEALIADLRRRGFRLALAMTSANVDTYEETRRFWKARGFLPLIELDIWDTDRALLQVRLLDAGGRRLKERTRGRPR
jgi:hypothetical protein